MTDEQYQNNTKSPNGDEASGSESPSHSDETVDPRVKVELERLNAATDLINKLEIELDEARSNFRLLLSESSNRVNTLAKKLGTCVDKARPYYEARMKAKQLQTRAQKAALRYERASSSHCAAKEMVYLAEEGLKKEGRCFDPAWQEMLNHATMKVNESESERILSQHEHQQTSLSYIEAERTVQHLHQELKRAITKSSLSTRRSLLQLNNVANQHQLQLLPYFEMKAHFNQLLDEQRRKVHGLEENVLKVKMSYADALHNLEEISDEIHQRRELLDKSIGSQDFNSSQSMDRVWNNQLRTPYRPFAESSSNECETEWESQHLFAPGDDGLKNDFSSSTNVHDFSESHPSKTDSALKHETLVNSSVVDSLSKPTLDNNRPHLNNSSQSSSQGICSSPESAEIQDQKHHVTDLNLLRVQKEDISDSESLASNDTVDTLDDNQIECLLLDQVLPTAYEKQLSINDS